MTNNPLTAGARLRLAVDEECPLQVMGVMNAYTAMMAEQVGFRALYLSGSGVATSSYGLPDLGITNLTDVLEDVRRITGVTTLPLLVDADTGWGGAFGIARTVREMSRTGAAGMHLEDQVSEKRCGHRPNKELVPASEMVDRLKAAVDGRTDESFVIMARTDAVANEGVEGALARAVRYQDAGADMIFAEAVTRLEDYRRFTETLRVPVLANMTEFGQTELFTTEQLGAQGVRLVLYPLSAHRAMNAAALRVFQTTRREGTQQATLDTMQTRDELYSFLHYHDYEARLDRLFSQETDDGD